MQVTDFIVCEDIREEQNNKCSLMGIFNDKIRLQGNLPPRPDVDVQLPMLSIYIRALREQNDFVPAFYRFKAMINGETKVETRAISKGDDLVHVLKIRIAGFPLRIGTLLFEVTYLDSSEKLTFKYQSRPITVGFESVQ